MRNKLFHLYILLFGISISLHSQGFLHRSGKNIVDGNDQNFLIRSIGTGNWMIQEGYMMQSGGAANTQHEFRNKLVQTVGVARADSFYHSWLHNHFTRTDVDSMASWGFNSIRVAMHYKWLTLPIEDEPIEGQQTWMEDGFVLLDSLLQWCSDNQMYLILDMHGAPGGQGKNADISDYDPSKPSLWESQLNKDKLAALWGKLAERYHDEPWIGGYDLINETNWDFENSNNENGCNCKSNTPLSLMFKAIIDSIRMYDQNHIVFLEGNCWGNNYSGLNSLATYDNNLAISFHKYWSYNDQGSIQGFLNMRNSLNVPLWLGESGENSNTWFANAIKLCESNNIGWSWWPVKKAGINNPLRVIVNQDYKNLIEYWKGNGPALTADEAFQAVMKFSDNHRIENCILQQNVIDAMIRQPFSNEIKEYKKQSVNDIIFATDYAMGRNGYAYYDKDTCDFHVSSGNFTAWNTGYSLRNDGVDIQSCTDSDTTNGYNVGWIEDGEWISYIIESDSATLFDIIFRMASESAKGYAQIEINGKIASKTQILPSTLSWTNWKSITLKDVIVPAGKNVIKVIFIEGGININYLKFTNPRPVDSVAFKSLSGQTAEITSEIELYLNKEISSNSVLNKSEFTLYSDNQAIEISEVKFDPSNFSTINITPKEFLNNSQQIKLSYNGIGVISDGQLLSPFQKIEIRNNLATHFDLPGKIEAENFYENNGLELEDCLDTGGGQNTGYASSGDYLDYAVTVPVSGVYQMDFRVALGAGNAELYVQNDQNGHFYTSKLVALSSTGGWQSWNTQTATVDLPRGQYKIRLLVKQGEHNINWFSLSLITPVKKVSQLNEILVYPNPVRDVINISTNNDLGISTKVELINNLGMLIAKFQWVNSPMTINTNQLDSGSYFLKISNEEVLTVKSFIKI